MYNFSYHPSNSFSKRLEARSFCHKRIMISVAATDILINPRAIARDGYECYKHGAAMVHLHCRDLNGRLTPDLSLLQETVAYIREMCDIVVEISTGGVSNLTIEERCPSWR